MTNAIKNFREKHNLTQQQMSDMYGININTIQNWEQGRSKCPDYVVELLIFDQFHRKMEKKWEEERKEYANRIVSLFEQADYWHKKMEEAEEMAKLKV